MLFKIQKRLNDILGISAFPEGFDKTDDELFDCSDYPDDGKVGNYGGALKRIDESKQNDELS